MDCVNRHSGSHELLCEVHPAVASGVVSNDGPQQSLALIWAKRATPMTNSPRLLVHSAALV